MGSVPAGKIDERVAVDILNRAAFRPLNDQRIQTAHEKTVEMERRHEKPASLVPGPQRTGHHFPEAFIESFTRRRVDVGRYTIGELAGILPDVDCRVYLADKSLAGKKSDRDPGEAGCQSSAVGSNHLVGVMN